MQKDRYDRTGNCLVRCEPWLTDFLGGGTLVIVAMVGLVRDNLLSVKDAAVRVGMTEDAFVAMLRK